MPHEFWNTWVWLTIRLDIFVWCEGAQYKPNYRHTIPEGSLVHNRITLPKKSFFPTVGRRRWLLVAHFALRRHPLPQRVHCHVLLGQEGRREEEGEGEGEGEEEEEEVEEEEEEEEIGDENDEAEGEEG